MRDFLDNLIERHTDAAPQIKPRLPSIFEPEVSHGGLDLAIEEKETTTFEETEALQQAPPAAQFVGASTIAELVQPIVSPVPTVPAREVKPSVKAVPNELVFPPRETTPTLPPPSQGGGEEGVPVMGRVHLTHREESTERTPSNPKATAENQSPIKGLDKPAFSLSPRERAGVREVNSTSGPLTLTLSQGERGLNQGFLKPSTPLIARVLPGVAGPERPIPSPEPVINVTIGRIEVRATVAPTREVQKPRSAPPVMTLDEYLRQRSKGERG